jgi:hypothetical protein
VTVLDPVETNHWTEDTMDAEIETIRERYLEVLGQG